MTFRVRLSSIKISKKLEKSSNNYTTIMLLTFLLQLVWSMLCKCFDFYRFFLCILTWRWPEREGHKHVILTVYEMQQGSFVYSSFQLFWKKWFKLGLHKVWPCRSLKWLDFAWWHVTFAWPQCGTCFMFPFWCLEFWGVF